MMKNVMIAGSLSLIFAVTPAFADHHGAMQEGMDKAQDMMEKGEKAHNAMDNMGNMDEHAKGMADNMKNEMSEKMSDTATDMKDAMGQKAADMTNEAVDGAAQKAGEVVDDAVKGVTQ